ncbi:hypothetical protein ASD15_30650 [Massilia sp. Root351]|nr:hypothetical protein ASD15_30650 [Massilia sp. Root351]
MIFVSNRCLALHVTHGHIVMLFGVHASASAVKVTIVIWIVRIIGMLLIAIVRRTITAFIELLTDLPKTDRLRRKRLGQIWRVERYPPILVG